MIVSYIYEYTYYKWYPPPTQLPVVLVKAKVIYTTWIKHIPNIPRTSRYTYGNRVDTLFLEFLEKIYATSYMPTKEKSIGLSQSIALLDTLRFLFQLGYESKLIPEKKYIELSSALIEIGKMLGGWKKGIDDKLIQTKTPSML